MRLCIDYRELNSKTIVDRYPIQRIQDKLDSLAGKKWFTTLDQGKAYHQGLVELTTQQLTAFVTPWVLRMLRQFQRFLEHCLADYRDEFCTPYVDAVTIYSKALEIMLSMLGRFYVT